MKVDWVNDESQLHGLGRLQSVEGDRSVVRKSYSCFLAVFKNNNSDDVPGPYMVTSAFYENSTATISRVSIWCKQAWNMEVLITHGFCDLKIHIYFWIKWHLHRQPTTQLLPKGLNFISSSWEQLEQCCWYSAPPSPLHKSW